MSVINKTDKKSENCFIFLKLLILEKEIKFLIIIELSKLADIKLLKKPNIINTHLVASIPKMINGEDIDRYIEFQIGG